MASLGRSSWKLGAMGKFSLTHLTRDSFIVEFDGQEYNVNGERGIDVWDIFPKMVYRRRANGKWQLVEDERLKTEIVAALQDHWPEYRYHWKLNLVND